MKSMNPMLIDILVEIGKLFITAIGEVAKENEQWILISVFAYAIMPIGKKKLQVHVDKKNEAPGAGTLRDSSYFFIADKQPLG